MRFLKNMELPTKISRFGEWHMQVVMHVTCNTRILKYSPVSTLSSVATPEELESTRAAGTFWFDMLAFCIIVRICTNVIAKMILAAFEDRLFIQQMS